ncbi:MAG: hypothetical protein KC983_10120, partial [Phycisphaerales bacterium]|nr:hypothetical protein [Phycisphaerales bacterium]
MPGKSSSSSSSSSTTGKSTTRANAGKMVYAFGPKLTEGTGAQKALLGGKGANLADMTSIGLPVPPGFT